MVDGYAFHLFKMHSIKAFVEAKDALLHGLQRKVRAQGFAIEIVVALPEPLGEITHIPGHYLSIKVAQLFHAVQVFACWVEHSFH